MATQAQTSTSTVAFVEETTFGETPANADFTLLPVVDITLGQSSEQLSSNTRRADRQTAYSHRGNSSAEGDLVVELTPDTYDAFLQAALQGVWTSSVLKIGSIKRSFAVEEGFELEAGYQYRVFNGVMVNTMSMEITTDSLVNATFGLIGTKETPFSGTSATDDEYLSTTSKDIFYHEGGSFNEGGVSVGSLSSISFELNNNITGNRALGNTGFRNLTSGKVNVTGTVTGLFESTALYNKFINNTDSALSFTLVAGAETLTFTFHRVKYGAATISKPADAGVTVEMQFEAIYDNTAANTLTITRV